MSASPGSKIIEVVERLRRGEEAGEWVEEALQKLERDLQGWAQRVQAVPVPPTHQELHAQIVEASMTSLQVYADAVGYVRAYASSGQEEYADTAVQMAQEGHALIAQLKGETDKKIDEVAAEEQQARQNPQVTYSEATDSVRMTADEQGVDSMELVSISESAHVAEESLETVELSTPLEEGSGEGG